MTVERDRLTATQLHSLGHATPSFARHTGLFARGGGGEERLRVVRVALCRADHGGADTRDGR